MKHGFKPQSHRFRKALKGGETMAKDKRCRSAITGKFVKESYANSHPKTTIKETVKKRSK